MSHVLIIEDDVDAARLMAMAAGEAGFTASTAHSLMAARRQRVTQPPDLVLLDLHLPDGNGLSLLGEEGGFANAHVVLLTGHASLETSIAALRAGVADYLLKPVGAKQLDAVFSRVMRPDSLQADIDDMRTEWQRSGRFGQMWGRSPAMQRVYDEIARVAGTAVTVFVNGESGTGKELVARTVHDLSRRRNGPFLAINCGAISPHLMESEIFGHEKGSFTGADRQHQGFFERAHGGTLFLDEVTEMPPELQVKLLRVLETGSFTRVGSTERRDADVRIVAATNRPPLQAVADHRLREDLYYRLNVFPISLPPLRDRGEDIALLAEQFLAEFGEREGRVKRFHTHVPPLLMRRAWPGNVRELRNAVQRAYVMTEGPVVHESATAPATLLQVSSPAWAGDSPPLLDAIGHAPGDTPELRVRIGSSIADMERQLILATMAHYDNNRERAAAVLGISLKTLYNRMREYAVDPAAHAA